MSAITSNTIVITAYPGKHGTINMSHNAEYSLLDTVDFDSDDSNSSGAGGPKKRRRLTHLSPDEKLLRRKLKNRVAAQTARDRKKALMAELEEKVAKLEEENKLLKRQNCSLKETSNTLAKENAALKSRLSESPLATVKTESDTSTCCSSAEGAGTDSVTMDGSVLHFSHNSQPDDFLCLLQEFAEGEQHECEKTQTVTPLSQGVCGGAESTDFGQRTNNGSLAPRMVGLSSAELESLNELIQIDHVYVKPQPLKSLGGKEIQKRSTPALIKQDPLSISPSQLNKQFVIVSGPKRSHCGDIVSKPPVVYVPESNSSDVNIKNATAELPILTSLSSQLELQEDSEDIISTLSDSDMETSLQLFENFDIDMVEPTRDMVEPTRPLDNDSSIQSVDFSIINPRDHLKLDEDMDLNSMKLFDEIYEHYLSIKESSVSSPSSAVLSDSGIGSDTEPLSPHSFDGDSILWQDTSFADLFPDLQ